MKRKRYTDEQIAYYLRQALEQWGRRVEEIVAGEKQSAEVKWIAE